MSQDTQIHQKLIINEDKLLAYSEILQMYSDEHELYRLVYYKLNPIYNTLRLLGFKQGWDANKSTRGVYVVYESTRRCLYERVLYVGSSDNMYRRINERNHIANSWETGSELVDVVIAYFPCENHRSKEIEMIRQLRPLLNIHHNGN